MQADKKMLEQDRNLSNCFENIFIAGGYYFIGIFFPLFFFPDVEIVSATNL